MTAPAALAGLLLLAAQPAQPGPAPDAPIGTALKPPPGANEAAAPTVTEPPAPVEIPAPKKKAPPGKKLAPSPKPAPNQKPAPGQQPAPQDFAFEPKTLVDGETLQVIIGQRAVVMLDDKGQPVLDAVQDGKLAVAHPDGAVTETFAPPAKGKLAMALDGSAEKRATTLKVWNGLDHPVMYRALLLVLRGKVLTPVPTAVCPVAAGGVTTQSWPAPIVAVGLARFKTATKEELAQPACKKGD